MKLIELTCNKCGAELKVNADLKKCMCQYCGNEMLIDDEIIHHQIDNAYDAGYQAEMGRQQAIKDIEKQKQQEIIAQQMKQQEEQRRQQEEARKRLDEEQSKPMHYVFLFIGFIYTIAVFICFFTHNLGVLLAITLILVLLIIIISIFMGVFSK